MTPMVDNDLEDEPDPEGFTDASPNPEGDADLAILCDALQERGVTRAAFRYEGSGDCMEELMLAVAPYLEGPWVIQCVGAEKCRFPLVACAWRAEPGGTEVQYNGFKRKSPRGAMKRDPVSVQ
jgi:hypothetical protein